jgi:hypothetical protein
MPSIVESVESILTCISLGLPFEFIPYRLGVSVLENSIKTISHKLIITVLSSVDSDGVDRFYPNVVKA